MLVETKTLCQKLGYTFNKAHLLEDALSHRSFKSDKNNERLEFLGDAVLNFVIAAALFHKYPQASEGQLSRLRANLVREETLTVLAQKFDLGRYLRLGIGELKSGGSKRISILADAMEAVVGAIYLDSDMLTCQACILRWYLPQMENFVETSELKDPKTRLQECLQAHKLPLPRYTILSIEGLAHQQIFHVECFIEDLAKKAVGVGTSRRRAEQAAAMKLLEQIEEGFLL